MAQKQCRVPQKKNNQLHSPCVSRVCAFYFLSGRDDGLMQLQQCGSACDDSDTYEHCRTAPRHIVCEIVRRTTAYKLRTLIILIDPESRYGYVCEFGIYLDIFGFHLMVPASGCGCGATWNKPNECQVDLCSNEGDIYRSFGIASHSKNLSISGISSPNHCEHVVFATSRVRCMSLWRWKDMRNSKYR